MISDTQLSQNDIPLNSDTSCSSGYVSPTKGWNHSDLLGTAGYVNMPSGYIPYSNSVSENYVSSLVASYNDKIEDNDMIQEFQALPGGYPLHSVAGVQNSHHMHQHHTQAYTPSSCTPAGYSHNFNFPFVTNFPFLMPSANSLDTVDGGAASKLTPGSGGGGGKSGKSGCERAKPKRKRVATVAQRRAANIRERRRMYSLNESFDSLRKKVPTFAYEKKLSRIETLRLAITYISFMGDLLQGKSPNNIRLATRKRILQDQGGGEATVPSLPNHHHQQQSFSSVESGLTPPFSQLASPQASDHTFQQHSLT